MQALDINEGHYDHQGYHNGGSDINYDSEVPNPPQDNNQVAAWYDTDLWKQSQIYDTAATTAIAATYRDNHSLFLNAFSISVTKTRQNFCIFFYIHLYIYLPEFISNLIRLS